MIGQFQEAEDRPVVCAMLSISAKYQAKAVIHHKGDLLQADPDTGRAAGQYSNPSLEMQEDIGHAANGDMICEAILSAHGHIRSGSPNLDPFHAEARTLALKGNLFQRLEELPEEQLWQWVLLGGEFAREFRSTAGNMKGQRIKLYNWGLAAKRVKRDKRRKNKAAAETTANQRARMASGDMFPDDPKIMAMSVDDLKARLYMWKERKPEFSGPPIFEEGKKPWLGSAGGIGTLQERLKKVVQFWSAERPSLQYVWTDESPAHVDAEVDGEPGSSSESSDDDDDGYAAVMCVNAGGYAASGSF